MTETPRTILENLIMHRGSFPQTLRLFLPTENRYLYVNNGSASIHMSAYGLMSSIRGERGEILDAFAKFEFIIIEMLRIKITGFEVSDDFLELIKKISAKPRIDVLKNIKVFDKPFADNLRTLFDVRNSLAHKFTVNEVIWDKRPLLIQENYNSFLQNLQQTWTELISKYNDMISDSDLNDVITKIQDFQARLQSSSASQDNNQQGSEQQS